MGVYVGGSSLVGLNMTHSKPLLLRMPHMLTIWVRVGLGVSGSVGSLGTGGPTLEQVWCTYLLRYLSRYGWLLGYMYDGGPTLYLSWCGASYPSPEQV